MAIHFSIEPGEQLTVESPERLAQASVYLHNELKNVREGETVVLQAQEPLMPAGIIKYVLEFLEQGFPTAPASGNNFDADYLAKVCNVLFAYQCVLDREQTQRLWNALKQKSSLHDSSRTRCWRTPIEQKETAIAERLAISAFVLGKQEALERELGVVVWALDSTLNTTVPDLLGLEAMRQEEQRHIFKEIRDQHYILCAEQNDPRHQRLGHEITKRVRAEHLGELTKSWEDNCKAHPKLRAYNPYKLIRKFEAAIKDPEPKPPVAPVAVPNGQFQPVSVRSFPVDLNKVGQKVGHGINVLKRRSLSDNMNNLALIEKFFGAVEERVRTRQRDRARKLIRARQKTENGWRRELGLPMEAPRPPSPKGKEPETDGLPVPGPHSRWPPQPLPPPPQTNGYGNHADWQENPHVLPVQNYGQWEEEDHGPAELSSWSTRRAPGQTNHHQVNHHQANHHEANHHYAGRVARGLQHMIPAIPGLGGHQHHHYNNSNNNNGRGRDHGVHVNGFDGPSNWQVDFDRPADEDSWDNGDDRWHAGPSN